MNWNKYQSEVSTQAQRWCLDYLIEPSFQGVNRIFKLSFENVANKLEHARNYLPNVEIQPINTKNIKML